MPLVISKSKILCTLGPSSDKAEQIEKLIAAGMNCVRINFSHGTEEDKTTLFERVRQANPTLAILCDIQGPKIRIGEVEEGVILRRGASFILTTEPVIGDWHRVSVSYANLPKEVKKGEMIFINDGIVGLEILGIEKTEIHCKVLNGGPIYTRKGLNLPSTELGLRVPTEKDIHDLALIAKLNPAFLAASFVGSAEDVTTIRHILASHNNLQTKIIAKIERPIAVENFDEILQASDGIMVARGDLGVELRPEEVPFIQKEMVKKCNQVGKPVIVATQMLESMVKTPIPTRAEVSDVYNAINDGADCVMLSAETASGDFPTEAVKVMRRIIRNAEEHLSPRDPGRYDAHNQSIPELLGHLVHDACEQLMHEGYGRGKILCLTQSGFTARMISKFRPRLPIVAVTQNQHTAREMNIYWGVQPLYMPKIMEQSNRASRIRLIWEECRKHNLVDDDETLVLVGDFFDLTHRTNMITLMRSTEIALLD